MDISDMPDDVRQMLEDDILIFGNGYVEKDSAGNYRRVNPMNVVIESDVDINKGIPSFHEIKARDDKILESNKIIMISKPRQGMTLNHDVFMNNDLIKLIRMKERADKNIEDYYAKDKI